MIYSKNQFKKSSKINMNKFSLYLFFTFTFCQSFYSQSPGFMGKRMVVSYGFHASPAIIGATKNNETLIGDLVNLTRKCRNRGN